MEIDNKTKEIYFKCSCGSEILNVIEEIDFFGDKNQHYNREFSFSIFRDYDAPYTLGRRLKYIWRILTTGKPHYDQIILKEEDVEKLGLWLKKRDEEFINDCKEKIKMVQDRK